MEQNKSHRKTMCKQNSPWSWSDSFLLVTICLLLIFRKLFVYNKNGLVQNHGLENYILENWTFKEFTLYLLVLSADNFCKQFGPRLDLTCTENQAWSGFKYDWQSDGQYSWKRYLKLLIWKTSADDKKSWKISQHAKSEERVAFSGFVLEVPIIWFWFNFNPLVCCTSLAWVLMGPYRSSTTEKRVWLV